MQLKKLTINASLPMAVLYLAVYNFGFGDVLT